MPAFFYLRDFSLHHHCLRLRIFEIVGSGKLIRVQRNHVGLGISVPENRSLLKDITSTL